MSALQDERERTPLAHIVEQDKLFRFLVENMLEGVVIVDWDTTLLFVNKVAAGLIGFESAKELIGRKSLEFVHPDSRDLLLENLQKVKRGESRVNNEYKFITKEGKNIWVETSGKKITFDGRSVDLVTFNDITDRKKTEEALKESEAKYKGLFKHVPAGIFQTTPEGKIISANPALVQMLGYESEAELCSLDVVADLYVDPEQRDVLARKLEKEGTVQDIELVLKRKDGYCITVLENTRAIRNEQGEILYYEGTLTDITERKRAEDALRESEELYRKLVLASPDAVTATDMEGRITHVSQSTLELYGFDSADDMLRRSVLDFIAPEDHERAVTNLQKTLTNGVVRNAEYTMIRKDGTHFIGELSAALVSDAEGNPKAFIVTTRDITERKHAEEQIKQSLREKEVLLKEIHHRVKNNMQVITSLLSLQSENIDDEKVLTIFKDSENRIRSMALIHNELYQSESFADVDFSQYIKALASDLVRSYGGYTGEIDLKIDAEDITLGIDTAIPCGLLINELVSNSLKHAFPKNRGGTIKISLHNIGTKVELVVSDNGVGIPDSIDFKHTRSLGLQLVTILAEEQLEGEIILDKSEGTAFRITFRR